MTVPATDVGVAGPARPWPILVPLLLAALAFSGFLVLFVLVASHNPMGWEVDVVDRAVGLPEVIGVPLRAIMQLGRRSLLPLVGLVVYLAVRQPRPALATVVAGLAAAVTVDLWKDWASRPRPGGLDVREAAHGFGFPSGHSAVAWALAPVIAGCLPARWRWLPFVAATMVAVGRLDAGVHYPLDVIGGSLWGLTVGLLVVAATGGRSARAELPEDLPGQ